MPSAPNIAFLHYSIPTTYAYEADYIKGQIPQAIDAMGGNPLALVYSEAPCEVGVGPGPAIFVDEEEREAIKTFVQKFILRNNISGIVLPGNHYEISIKGTVAPDPKRARDKGTLALIEVAQEMNMPICGFCGGLQAMVYSICGDSGIQKIGGKTHDLSPTDEDGAVISGSLHWGDTHEVIITARNWLHRTLQGREGVEGGSNRIITLDITSAHHFCCDTSEATLDTLAAAGLTIVGWSEDGTAEIIINVDPKQQFRFFTQGHVDVDELLWPSVLRDTFIQAAMDYELSLATGSTRAAILRRRSVERGPPPSRSH